MDLAKSFEYFNPDNCTESIHIIGCGATGSTIAELLVRYGLTNLVLWDFDSVEPHNITNQLYVESDIHKPKVEALKDHLILVNPNLTNTVSLEAEGWNGEPLDGYVFLCVDNIDLMREITQQSQYNPHVKAIINPRMRLTDGQIYSGDWTSPASVTQLLKTMNFSSEEAKADTPVSACNVELSVATTVRICSALAVQNLVNFINGQPLKQTIFFDLSKWQFDIFN